MLNCSIDASQYAEEFQQKCEELGGKQFVGTLGLDCVISGAFIPDSTGTDIAFSWDIQNDNTCLGAGCTDADYEKIINAGFAQVNDQLGLLGSCEYSFDPSGSTAGTTPPTTSTTTPGSPTMAPLPIPDIPQETTSPGSPTMEPASPNPGTTPTVSAPGSPTMEPSAENAVDGQPPSPTDAPVSTPAPTSGTRQAIGMTILVTLLPVSAGGVVSWIMGVF